MVDPYGNPYAMHPYGMGPYAAGPTGAMGPQSMALVPVGECYTGNRYKCCYKHYNVFTKLRGCCVSIPCSFSSCSSPHLFIFVLLLLPILLLLITPLVPPSLPPSLHAYLQAWVCQVAGWPWCLTEWGHLQDLPAHWRGLQVCHVACVFEFDFLIFETIQTTTTTTTHTHIAAPSPMLPCRCRARSSQPLQPLPDSSTAGCWQRGT